MEKLYGFLLVYFISIMIIDFQHNFMNFTSFLFWFLLLFLLFFCFFPFWLFLWLLFFLFVFLFFIFIFFVLIVIGIFSIIQFLFCLGKGCKAIFFSLFFSLLSGRCFIDDAFNIESVDKGCFFLFFFLFAFFTFIFLFLFNWLDGNNSMKFHAQMEAHIMCFLFSGFDGAFFSIIFLLWSPLEAFNFRYPSL